MKKGSVNLFFQLLLFLLIYLLPLPTIGSAVATTSQTVASFDSDLALRLSQAAVGRSLENQTFFDQNGNSLALDDFKGKPLLVSLVYTSCYHTCSMTTRALASVVEKAREAFGRDSFTVLTIGFDTTFDTPKAMGYFARQQGMSDDNWYFISGDAATLERLIANIGFSYVPSPKGYDHLVQTTVVDAKGVVYRQVYGEIIKTPLLLEPLKELILGVSPAAEGSVETLVRRVRLFCTTYDPAADAYRFDYSLFVGIFIGAFIIIFTGFLLFRELRRAKKMRNS